MRHPWLDGRFPVVATLDDDERLLTFVAAHTASGDLDALDRAYAALAEPIRPAALEVVLQTHLFAGYPRTINALARLRHHGCTLNDSLEGPDSARAGREGWRADGEALCARIYGDAYQALRRRMASLHVDLDAWMVETGYGRVLSRPGLSPRMRELCVLVVLAGQNVVPQLRSHLQGALHVGATREECGSVLAQTETLWGEVAQGQVDAVWRAFVGRS